METSSPKISNLTPNFLQMLDMHQSGYYSFTLQESFQSRSPFDIETYTFNSVQSYCNYNPTPYLEPDNMQENWKDFIKFFPKARNLKKLSLKDCSARSPICGPLLLRKNLAKFSSIEYFKLIYNPQFTRRGPEIPKRLLSAFSYGLDLKSLILDFEQTKQAPLSIIVENLAKSLRRLSKLEEFVLKFHDETSIKKDHFLNMIRILPSFEYLKKLELKGLTDGWLNKQSFEEIFRIIKTKSSLKSIKLKMKTFICKGKPIDYFKFENCFKNLETLDLELLNWEFSPEDLIMLGKSINSHSKISELCLSLRVTTEVTPDIFTEFLEILGKSLKPKKLRLFACYPENAFTYSEKGMIKNMSWIENWKDLKTLYISSNLFESLEVLKEYFEILSSLKELKELDLWGHEYLTDDSSGFFFTASTKLSKLEKLKLDLNFGLYLDEDSAEKISNAFLELQELKDLNISIMFMDNQSALRFFSNLKIKMTSIKKLKHLKLKIFNFGELDPVLAEVGNMIIEATELESIMIDLGMLSDKNPFLDLMSKICLLKNLKSFYIKIPSNQFNITGNELTEVIIGLEAIRELGNFLISFKGDEDEYE